MASAPFFARFLAHPKRVGAIAPSGAFLARAVVAEADLSGDVLELGPGSGAFTAALLEAGLPPSRLTAIEYDASFAAALRRRFPGVGILQGDAFSFAALTPGLRFSSVISGLPLLNYGRDEDRALIASALMAMPKGAPFVQFSYGWNAPVEPPEGATVHKATRIWKNLPPAAVWVYRRG
ncbi:phosphatidylethanolamine/phosphatidyl-N-methylethanolamine N-methyltransferase [Rhizomicrobium palustre]|uniref:Phosphatidylethanolamine/phosphatidyl-N-methylethanolamine N-methyltransferase n=1 Tax=Rhizomicrobium palustre TaxID=189966 RepID=A0A846MY97_9PROT|nr:rRNA adenine N-6-methyltransferase family protein [Rhizomicrobium palustre]NIK88263.1 phosphatidylethanolamine/phosphatidyl-N-methylethanolamine N-methyltransferase [Rhizomicrobium palustre]